MILLKHKRSTPGTRHKKNAISFFYKNIRHKFAFISKLKSKARCTHNGIMVFSRKSPFLKKSLRLNNQRYLTPKLGIFLKFHFNYKNSSDKGLFKFSNGSYCSMQIPFGLIPGAYTKATNLPTNFISPFNLGDSVVLY